MAYLCKQHGKIRSIGKAVSYCPLCGQEVYCVSFFPRIYIDKVLCWTVFWVACGLLVAGGITKLVTHHLAYCNEAAARMDPTWRTLYVEVWQVQCSDELKTVQTFVNTNNKYLQSHPITPEAVQLILHESSSGNEGAIAQLLTPYEVPSAP